MYNKEIRDYSSCIPYTVFIYIALVFNKTFPRQFPFFKFFKHGKADLEDDYADFHIIVNISN